MAPSTNPAQPTVHVAHDRAVMVAAVDVAGTKPSATGPTAMSGSRPAHARLPPQTLRGHRFAVKPRRDDGY